MQSVHRVHFLNACRNQQNTFSCSIDCFLEIAANIFLPSLPERNPIDQRNAVNI